jgi:hypothetical protein
MHTIVLNPVALYWHLLEWLQVFTVHYRIPLLFVTASGSYFYVVSTNSPRRGGGGWRITEGVAVNYNRSHHRLHRHHQECKALLSFVGLTTCLVPTHSVHLYVHQGVYIYVHPTSCPSHGLVGGEGWGGYATHYVLRTCGALPWWRIHLLNDHKTFEPKHSWHIDRHRALPTRGSWSTGQPGLLTVLRFYTTPTGR